MNCLKSCALEAPIHFLTPISRVRVDALAEERLVKLTDAIMRIKIPTRTKVLIYAP